MAESESGGGASVDVSKGVEIDGQTFFPLSRPRGTPQANAKYFFRFLRR